MIHFGPAGNSASFYAQGHKHTVEAFAWISDMGLDAYEYSFGRGVRITKATAELIGLAAEANGVSLSVHAPYYINLATHEPEKAAGNLRYLAQSAEAARWMGAKRVVFHPGAQGGMPRSEALARVKASLMLVIEHLENEGLFDIEICPETMGKIKQIGDLDEVIQLCKMDGRIVPAIDFGHLHARGRGAIQSLDDYAAILDRLEEKLGGYRAKRFHVHFSRIAYTDAGERMHKTFADEGFGPDFAPLARLLAKRGLEPVMICESKGTMAEDAAEMKRMYLEELEKQ
ncbi:MAG: TIM barrel protein [Eubacteriales bacterium]|nr:TIM barrel protein [Eubacteriales bacterium]